MTLSTGGIVGRKRSSFVLHVNNDFDWTSVKSQGTPQKVNRKANYQRQTKDDEIGFSPGRM